MARLSIVLTEEELKRLQELARRELRPTKLQAVVLIRDGLRRRQAPERVAAAAK
jgi:hypothetical protein